MKKIERVRIKLFLTFLFTSLFFIGWYGGNEESNFALVRSIVENGQFEIDSFYNQTIDRAVYNEHYYSDKDPGLALFSTPIYATWKFVYNFFPNSFRERYKGNNEYIERVYDDTSLIIIIDKGFFLFTSMILVTFFTSGIFTTLTAFLIFKISKYFLRKNRDRILLTLTYFFGTIAFNYSLHFMNHALSTFFLFLSFFTLFKTRKVKSISRTLALAGIFLGFSIVVDKLSLLFLPIFLIYTLCLNRKNTHVFLLFVIISSLPYVFYNYTIFQNPFELTSTYIDRRIYKHAYPLESISTLDKKVVESSFIDIKSLIRQLHLKTIIPNPYIMLRLLFYPYRGLFFYSPILILSIPGLFLMWKKYKKEVIIILSMLLILLFPISMREVWWGGFCFGARYLLLIIPFLMLPLTFSIKKFGIKIFLLLLSISVFINFLGLQISEEVAYNWFVRDIRDEWKYKQNSFEVIYNPILQHYLPLSLKYGPRSAIFEHLSNGYISIDIRSYPLSKGKYFPFSQFFIPFLSLLIYLLIISFIWNDELVIKLRR